MRCTMDAFIAAVEDARHRLIRQEGSNVSMREIFRRAGYDESQRPGVSYHFNKNQKWPKGHKVPPELVARLTGPRQDGQPGRVLPISHEELARAAQIAAGYTVEVNGAELLSAYARFMGDSDVEDAEKQGVTARLLQIIADETAKRVSTS